MATTTDTYRVISLDDSFQQGSATPDGERTYARIRRDLDIGAFGAYAIRADAGKELVHERTATHPAADGHEELFVVIGGHARFTIDGAEIEAPAGTAIFVRDVDAKRAAVAVDGKATVLLVGGRRGAAWRLTPGEATEEFWPLYEAKDYEGALAVERQALEDYPGNALAHYNIACMSSLLGRPDDALEHLAAALDGWPEYVENARKDDDFEPLRDDPRFRNLVEATED
jgi:tetratricopeptide (TPR) repeat protein